MKISIIIQFLIGISFLSCKKLVEIDAPVNSITTAAVFADSADANAGILGIYADILSQSASLSFGNGATTLYCGTSADELVPYFLNNKNNKQLYQNKLIATNGLSQSFWPQIYSCIYEANSCIEGLQASTKLKAGFRNELIGEAKFLRAFCYFYLVNLYGAVPYVTSASGWAQTALASRASIADIYKNMIQDLLDAQNMLYTDYSISDNQRTRANQSTTTALLARVYLYTGDWSDAKTQSSAVINNTTYALTDLNDIFLANSSESILQWQPNTAWDPFNVTAEGYNLLPQDTNSEPVSYYLNSSLVNSFEVNDQREIAWVTYSNYNGNVYYYPYKYKMGTAQYGTSSTATEYYTVLRLAEQYLIRAEAEAQLNELTDAITDLNTIRTRAGLPPLPSTLVQSQVVNAVAQERKIELFAEWGHRWFDIKRTGQIDSVMGIATPQKGGGNTWNTNQQLYPIPPSELLVDPNLTQNEGY